MSRKPAFLAALASSAVPGLDPVSVRGARRPGRHHEVAFITDAQERSWVVRAPLSAAAGAQMDTTVALLGLIGRRLPFAVPAPRGFAAVPEGRAVVYPFISGRPIDFAALPAGAGLAAEIGRAIAALHNIDRMVFDEAGLPAYDAEEYRSRRLADLDRAAATGHVPTTLLARWERALENVSIWRFAPTPIHGGITGEQVLVVFENEQDARSGKVRGLTGWDDAKVADPAEDFASLVTRCRPETFESILEAYAHSRVERPDRHLSRRARLAAELHLLNDLLDAVSAGRQRAVQACAADLRDLDDATIDEPDEDRPAGEPRAAPAARRIVPATPIRRVGGDRDAGTDEALRSARMAGETAEARGYDGDHTQPITDGRLGDPTVVVADTRAGAAGPSATQPMSARAPDAQEAVVAPDVDAPGAPDTEPPEAQPSALQPAADDPDAETGDADDHLDADDDPDVDAADDAAAEDDDAADETPAPSTEPAERDEPAELIEPPDRFR